VSVPSSVGIRTCGHEVREDAGRGATDALSADMAAVREEPTPLLQRGVDDDDHDAT
jgi:hypothetical protein